MAQNAYLIGCQRTGEAIITAVADTHIHADHLSGARELVERYGAIACLSVEGGPGRS